MSIWTLTLIAVVTLIWAGMLGAVARLAAQNAQTRNGQAAGDDTGLH